MSKNKTWFSLNTYLNLSFLLGSWTSSILYIPEQKPFWNHYWYFCFFCSCFLSLCQSSFSIFMAVHNFNAHINLGRMVLLYDMAGLSFWWYALPTKGNDTITNTPSNVLVLAIEFTSSFIRYLASLASTCGSRSSPFDLKVRP